MREYEFCDEWRVAADPAQVWEVVRRVELWPTWWPSVRSVTEVGTAGTAPAAWRFVFQTRLPYRMEFTAHVVRDDPLHGAETTVTGRVEGIGRWNVTPVEGGSLVRFTWIVRPQLAWMRALSPLARPLFVWNHRELMREGGEALAARLDTRLVAPPVCAPAVAPAVAGVVVRAVAGLATLAGLRMLLQDRWAEWPSGRLRRAQRGMRP